MTAVNKQGNKLTSRHYILGLRLVLVSKLRKENSHKAELRSLWAVMKKNRVLVKPRALNKNQ